MSSIVDTWEWLSKPDTVATSAPPAIISDADVWRNEWTFKFDEIMAGTDDAVESVSIGWPCWYAKTKNEFF